MPNEIKPGRIRLRLWRSISPKPPPINLIVLRPDLFLGNDSAWNTPQLPLELVRLFQCESAN
jgi:hypothetical protein